jgi:hypothetical protein
MTFGTLNVDTITNSNGLSGNAIGPGFKNRLINGTFAVAQRGTSFASGANNNDAYTLDRWYILSDGNDAIDVTQETSTVPTNGQFAIALDVETTNKKFGIAQIIENKNCNGAIGSTVTVSFQAKVSSTTKLDNVKCAIVAWSGTADSVTSDIISAWNVEGTNPTLIANATYENTPANLNVTTNYATYSVSGAVDTASTKNIIVFIWSDVTDTTAGDFLYITNVQLEVAPSATSFDYRPFGTELALCQRYYERWAASGGSGDVAFMTQAIGTNIAVGGPFHMKVTKRTTSPTITYSSNSHFNFTSASNSNNQTGSLDSSIVNANTFRVLGTSIASSPLVAGNASVIAANTSSAYIEMGAEL